MTRSWLDVEIQKTQIIVMAGGKAKRMGADIPKCLLEISGKKLVDICVESLVKDGFRDFVFLLGHKHELVTQHVGDGNKYGIKARHSIDPDSVLGWGKGKAFKHALLTKRIDSSKRCIIVFPDDILLEDHIYSNLLMNHVEAQQKQGITASSLLVPGTEYPYGVAELDENGVVQSFTEKPFLDKPTSVGVYIFEPAVYDIIQNKISLDDPSPVDLESTIMPELVTERRLAGMIMSSKKWIPVNTMKEYEQAVKILSKAI
jgi:NDP-sugar pyrophosphorylase family protein